MDAAGRLTLPREVRADLHLNGRARFVVEYNRKTIVLWPVHTTRHEDCWAYTSTHRRLLAAALGDIESGRVSRLGPTPPCASS